MELRIQRFLNALRSRRNFSPHTLRAYAADLAEFAAFWTAVGGGEPEALTRTRVRAYMASLQTRMAEGKSKGLSRASLLRKIAALRSFVAWLQDEEELVKDPFLSVPLPKRERRLPAFLTENEMTQLLESVAAGEKWVELRDRAILELLYSSGLRRSEMARLNVADVDFYGGVVRVFGKGARERVVPVGETALKALKAYLDARPAPKEPGRAEPVWLNVQARRLSDAGIAMIVRSSVKKAGLHKRISPHAIRHSFATQLLDNGCDLRALQEMLGHKNLTTTQIYTHTTLEKLRGVYKNAHPRSEK